MFTESGTGEGVDHVLVPVIASISEAATGRVARDRALVTEIVTHVEDGPAPDRAVVHAL